MYIKEANKSHCDLLFNWTNDNEVRENSFNKGKIGYEDHVKWFNNILIEKDSYIFIAYIESIPIGQIRFDMQGKMGIISYSVSKDFRGKGYGKNIIELLESKLKEENKNINTLIAYVKHENIPSQKIFEKLNYIKKDSIDKIEYYKYLQ